jgi:protein SCO1
MSLFDLNRLRVFVGAALIILCSSFFLGCTSKQAKDESTKRYKLTGRVVSVDKANKSILVDGNDIPGFMSAMTMPYKVKNDSELDKAAPGDTISADIVGQNDDYWLENINVTQHSATPPSKPSAALHIPESGEQVPDFTLVNQSGRQMSFDQYRGKALILTFIYTRCPFPDFCPRVSGQFADLNQKLETDPTLYRKTHLLSISFDPAHDTPRILRDYGFAYLKNKQTNAFGHWEFAVSSTSELPKLANFFALSYSEAGGTLTHSLSTAVIGPDGKIFKWYHGNDWTAADLLKDATDALRVTS